MKRKIVIAPDPVLRTICADIDLEKNKGLVKKLAADLADSIQSKGHFFGVGLAAPQIAKKYRMFVTAVPEDGEKTVPLVFINPIFTEKKGILELGENPEDPDIEGCLSLPNVWGPVPRFSDITIKFSTINNKGQLIELEQTFSHFHARVIQHEYDHLDGILFTDYSKEYKLPLYQREGKEYIEIDPTFADSV
jgi:peptide deformylase